MLHSVSRTADAYDALYRGKTLVIKVSGAEIASDDFSVLAEDIQWLIQRDIRIILVYGGGEQIGECYGRERRKIDGVGVTDDSVMREGVLPANAGIRLRIASMLPEGVFVEPHRLSCDRHPDARYGLVGLPSSIALPDAPLILVGFLGQEQNGTLLNVNADDVARLIVEQERGKIEELLFLTKTGGVLTTDDEIATLLTGDRLDAIIEGRDPKVTVDGGMRKKLIEVRRILGSVGKVAITTTRGLREEIERWKGSGTLCLDMEQASVSDMLPTEATIFDAVYSEFSEQGIFRKREEAELTELKKHHKILRVKNSPLGGYSLVPRGEWLELSTVWAATIGNGIGQMLLRAAHEQAQNEKRPMFALTTNGDAIRAFNACSERYENLGPLSEAIVHSPERVPEHLKEYDTQTRNPHLFIALPKPKE